LCNLIGLLKDQADCYALCAHPEVARRLRAEQVELLCLPSGGRWVKLLRFLGAPFAMVWMILRHRIDIIQINGFFEGILLLPARLLGCVAISTRHITFDQGSVFSRESRPSLGWIIDELIYRKTVRFANRVICVSAAVGSQVRALLPSMPAFVIPNWIPQVPPRVRESFSLHRPARILFVGRLEKMKGLHVLIDALQGLEDVTLTVVGDGDCRQQLEQHAAGLDVRFAGYQADPGAYYSDADVMVNPSLGPEGSSIVALEAMAHGVPCLLSDLPVFREVAEDGKAAMLFRTGDVEHLRDQLLALLGDEGLRQRYGHYGYSMVQAKHSAAVAQQHYSRAFGITVASLSASPLNNREEAESLIAEIDA
jgi:glycosyltransferase involved in cell wall biosynthesis